MVVWYIRFIKNFLGNNRVVILCKLNNLTYWCSVFSYLFSIVLFCDFTVSISNTTQLCNISRKKIYENVKFKHILLIVGAISLCRLCWEGATVIFIGTRLTLEYAEMYTIWYMCRMSTVSSPPSLWLMCGIC